MANERIPTDPYQPGLDPEYRDRPRRLEEDLQIDPELQEEAPSGGKIALFAVGLALILGAVFYGLNNTSIKEAQTSPPPPSQTAQTQPASPQAPTGMRDVTPKTTDNKATDNNATGDKSDNRPNTQPGMTTGAAPSSPTPPKRAPSSTSSSCSRRTAASCRPRSPPPAARPPWQHCGPLPAPSAP